MPCRNPPSAALCAIAAAFLSCFNSRSRTVQVERPSYGSSAKTIDVTPGGRRPATLRSAGRRGGTFPGCRGRRCRTGRGVDAVGWRRAVEQIRRVGGAHLEQHAEFDQRSVARSTSRLTSLYESTRRASGRSRPGRYERSGPLRVRPLWLVAIGRKAEVVLAAAGIAEAAGVVDQQVPGRSVFFAGRSARPRRRFGGDAGRMRRFATVIDRLRAFESAARRRERRIGARAIEDEVRGEPRAASADDARASTPNADSSSLPTTTSNCCRRRAQNGRTSVP